MNLPPRSGCGTQLQHTDPRAQWQFASLLLRLLRLHFVWASWFIFSSDVPTVSYQCLGRIGFLTCLHLMSLEEAQHLWLVRLRNLVLNPGCDGSSWCVELRIGNTSCHCCDVFFFLLWLCSLYPKSENQCSACHLGVLIIALWNVWLLHVL